VSCVDVQQRRRRLYGDELTNARTWTHNALCCRASTCVRQRTAPAIRSVNRALNCRQSRRVVSDVGISYRPCHFLDIWHLVVPKISASVWHYSSVQQSTIFHHMTSFYEMSSYTTGQLLSTRSPNLAISMDATNIVPYDQIWTADVSTTVTTAWLACEQS